MSHESLGFESGLSERIALHATKQSRQHQEATEHSQQIRCKLLLGSLALPLCQKLKVVADFETYTSSLLVQKTGQAVAWTRP